MTSGRMRLVGWAFEAQRRDLIRHETYQKYDDGEKDQKTWVLTRQPNGAWSGPREDVGGVARGWQDGKAFRLAYDVVLPNDDGSPGMQVHFQDVMVKRPDGVMLNNASVGWWGFSVASVELEIRRSE